MAALRTLIALLALSTIGFASAAAPECFQYTNCSSCTGAPSGACGWDPRNSLCSAGTAAGPSAIAGWSGNWWWTSDQCCAAKVGCTACTDESSVGFCGWDENEMRCMAAGARGGLVPSPLILHSAVCTSECTTHADCSSCVAVEGCGWIEGRQACAAGTSERPYQDQRSSVLPLYVVLYDRWYWSSCPAPGWTLRWSAKSYSLWCIVVGAAAVCVALSAGLAVRRRRARQQALSSAVKPMIVPLTASLPEDAPVGVPMFGAAHCDVEKVLV